MRTPKKGDDVKIKFRDHMKNATEPHSYIVWGRINEITDEAIILDWWANPDPDQSRNLGDEVECVVILRKVIEAISVVVEWKDL